MSLFPVSRYLGEDGVDLDGGGEEEGLEKKRLKKLLKKAKIRKAQGGEDGQDKDKMGDNEEEPKKKRRKAAAGGMKDVEIEENVQTRDTETATPAGKVKLSRKQKRKAKKITKKALLTGTELGADYGGFTVIGDVSQFRHQTVKRILPEWLSNPTFISSNLKDANLPVTSIGLDQQIAETLQHNFIPYFFPVQQQVIPWLISCHMPKVFRPSDICISAPTGSGKTLAYVLPIVHILKATRMYPCVRAIIVLPTEVLATQVYSVFKTYCVATGLSVFLMSKRLTFSAEREALVKCGVTGRLSCPYDVIVATPGRLIDHLEQTEEFDISQLKFLVVDEADRTLDDQEGDWLQRLENKFWSSHPVGCSQPWRSLPLTVTWLPVHLQAFQKLLFSATLSQNPESLQKLHLFEPKLFTSIVEKRRSATEDVVAALASVSGDQEEAASNAISEGFIGKYSIPTELVESFVLCKKETKPLVLTYLISHHKWKRVLCFANTKESTHRLCLLLKFMGHLKVREVSGTWSPKARDIVLKKFVNGSIDILVTSDQMARGMDIPQVDYVISYDLPGYTKTYIHRVGRCARAGREGQSVSLVTQEQIGIYKKTMKQTGKTNFMKIHVKNSDMRPLEESFRDALAKLKSHVEDEGDKMKRPTSTTLPGKNEVAEAEAD